MTQSSSWSSSITKTASPSDSPHVTTYLRRERFLIYAYISALYVLFTSEFFSTISAHPLKWRNVELDVDVTTEDLGWQEFVMMWSDENLLREEPLLKKDSREQTSPQIFDIIPLEENTLRTRELLRKRKSFLQKSAGLPLIFGRMVGSFYIKKLVANAKTRVSCGACKTGVGLMLYQARRSRDSPGDVVKLVTNLCLAFRIKTSQFCHGIMRMFGDRVVYVLQRLKMKAEQICSFVDFCGEVSNPAHEWEVSFPPIEKPDVIAFIPGEVDQTSFKVLQISDTHLDLQYAEGTNAKCDEMLCCRASEGHRSKNIADLAGKWGDYRKCDTPLRTLDNMLQHISTTHRDIDYILWTGDLNPHDLWKRSAEENRNILRLTAEKLKMRFPGIPIFAALGNHDSWPPYSFPPPTVENSEYLNDWWYNELVEQWENWLPSTTSRTIRRGAFYSVLVRPGFRIISLNMNFCLKKNWWLLINSIDPANELQWLIYELQTAELNREKVHIIGHIPPGDTDCLKIWSRNYYEIVFRYESTIRAQFFGHTHFDEFELFYDPKNLERPVNITYLGPSVTTYIGLNPGYRIYYIDGDHDNTTRVVLDHETWVMNLEEANYTDEPVWYKLYSAKSAYGLPNLLPHEWNNFIHGLERTEESFIMFHKHYWKNSSVRPPCKSKCKRDLICNLRSGRSHDQKTLCRKKEKKPIRAPDDKQLVKRAPSRISTMKKAFSMACSSSSAED